MKSNVTLVVISHYWGQHVSGEAANGGFGAVTMKEARTPLMPAGLSVPPQSGTSFLASSDRTLSISIPKTSVFLVSSAHTYAQLNPPHISYDKYSICNMFFY